MSSLQGTQGAVWVSAGEELWQLQGSMKQATQFVAFWRGLAKATLSSVPSMKPFECRSFFVLGTNIYESLQCA